jgi:cell division protein FtsA
MHYRIGLDIGSHTIRGAIVQSQRDGSFMLVGLLKAPTAGIRRGAIDNPSQFTQSLSPIIAQAKGFSRSAIKNISIGIGGVDLKVQYSKGVVAVSRADDEIYQDDISRVLQSARALNLPANRVVIDTVIKEYVVDGITGIHDPLGMIGKRLEVNMLLIDAFAPSVKSLERCVETLGAHVEQLVVAPLAAASAVLSQNQKELGVMLIDIGFGSTKIALFEENRLTHVAVIPVGSSNITNDLAIGLRIPIEVAEIIKLTYGSAIAKEVSARDAIELSKVDPRAKGTVTKKFIAEIIEDRLAEIFELVNNEVKRVGKASQLPAGAVLVGGGAKIPNIAELARQELKLSAQIGVPDLTGITPSNSELSIQAEDPEFATALGLVLYQQAQASEFATPTQFNTWFKKILNYFIP